MVSVHGDDFLGEGTDVALDNLARVLLANFEVKVGPRVGPGFGARCRLLKRQLLWGPAGFGWLPDPRHVARAAEALGLTTAKPAPTPAVRDSEAATPDGEDELDEKAAYTYRSVNGRLLYLSADRLDLQYGIKETSRGMSRPLQRDLVRLRRLVRYALGTGNLMLVFRYQALPSEVRVAVDGDWAGDVRSRKSTSCDAAFFGDHLLESHAVSQQVIALSSAESEFYAIGSGTASGLFFKHLLAEQGLEVNLAVVTDSSAAKTMVQRVGVGRVRHIEVRFLWVQEEQRKGNVEVRKTLGAENVADLGTKPVTKETLARLMLKLPLVLPLEQDGWFPEPDGEQQKQHEGEQKQHEKNEQHQQKDPGQRTDPGQQKDPGQRNDPGQQNDPDQPKDPNQQNDPDQRNDPNQQRIPGKKVVLVNRGARAQ